MKKLLFITFILSCFFLYSEDYHSYNLELIHKFQQGSAEGEIEAWDSNLGKNPAAMLFDEMGYLLLADNGNRMIEKYDNFFNEIEKYYFPYAYNGLDGLTRTWVGIFHSYEIAISMIETNDIIYIDGYELLNKTRLSPVFYKMHSFFYDEDGNIYCIPDPGPDYTNFDAKEAKIYKNGEVVALFEPGSGVDMKGLTIDGDYNLFDPEGNLLVRDYQRFINYWYNIHEKTNANPPSNNFLVSFDLRKPTSPQLMGFDARGNSYWDIGLYVYVFSKEGWMIDLFKYDHTKSHTRPAVHPNGDVYFLDYDKDWVYLYKIPNTWDPFDWQPPAAAESHPTARVNSGGLRVRDNPVTANSTVLGKLNLNQNVEILGQSADELTIDGLTAPWYKIRTTDGLEGWVFGGYLDLEKD